MRFLQHIFISFFRKIDIICVLKFFMESLFSASITPLASLLRPMFLNDYVGQSHLVAPGKPIHTFLKAGKIPSLLLW